MYSAVVVYSQEVNRTVKEGTYSKQERGKDEAVRL
jgi:hypothetical protein